MAAAMEWRWELETAWQSVMEMVRVSVEESAWERALLREMASELLKALALARERALV